MRVRPVRAFVVVVTVSAVAVLALGAAAPAAPTKKVVKIDKGATLRVAQNVSPTTWDPLKWASPIAASQFLSYPYDQLVEYSPELKPKPMLATSWSTPSDGLSMTMKLRTDVKFQDGSPFDASVVKANMDRALAAPAFKAAMPTVTSVNVVDASTVRFTFSGPTFNFADGLATDMRISSMVSPKGLNDANLGTKPAGSGPYEVVSYNTSIAVFERIASHWDKTSGLAKRVEVSVILDPNARLNALQSGQVDMAYVTLDQVPAARSANLKLNEFKDTVAVQALKANYSRPAFSNPLVRQAVSLALDREAIATIAYGEGTCNPTRQIFTKFTSGYLPDADTKKALKQDVAGAKKLLAQAGASNLTLSLILPTGNSSLTNAAQLVQQQLAAVNIKVNITPLPSSQATIDFADGGSDLYQSNVQGSAESQSLIDANLRARGFGWGVPDYLTSLVDQAAKTPLGAARDKLYQKINETLIDKPTHIPLCANEAFYGMSSKVVGVEDNAYGRVSQGIMDARRIGITKGK